MIKVTVSPVFGREVTASEFIFKDDEIMACELLVLSEFDTQVVNNTGLQDCPLVDSTKYVDKNMVG